MTSNKRIKLSSQIAPKLHPIMSKQALDGVEDIIITSGRSGSKSSAMSIKVAYESLAKPSAHVVMRKHKNKLRSTVFTEMKKGFTRLGISEKRSLDVRVSPFLIRVKNNESAIYFAGSDNPEDTKGMTDENFPISTVVIDEVNEFFKMGYERGKEEIDNIGATFVRGNNSGNFKMFYMFNPPKNPNAPVMKWLNEKKYIHDENGNIVELNPKTLHIHITYKDVPLEWNGQDAWNKAEETKRIDENYYRWLWLGECIGVDNVIYHMFNEKKHIQEYKGQRLINLGIGVDYGHQNATTFNAFGINQDSKKLMGVGGYKHSGRESRRMKSPSDYANDLVEFIKEVENKTKQRVKFVVVDPSASGFIEEARRSIRKAGLSYVTVRTAKNDVALGISRVQTLLHYESMTIDPSQKGAIEEFGLYSYDPKSIDRGDEKPIKDNDHDMDGIRYLVMEQYSIMKQLLNIKED